MMLSKSNSPFGPSKTVGAPIASKWGAAIQPTNHFASSNENDRELSNNGPGLGLDIKHSDPSSKNTEEKIVSDSKQLTETKNKEVPKVGGLGLIGQKTGGYVGARGNTSTALGVGLCRQTIGSGITSGVGSATKLSLGKCLQNPSCASSKINGLEIFIRVKGQKILREELLAVVKTLYNELPEEERELYEKLAQSKNVN